MAIFAEVHRRGGIKQQWRCRQQQSLAFSLAIFSDTLEMRPALLHGNTQSIVFSVIPKCMTLNDPDWLFRIKFCFRAGLAGWDHATWKTLPWKVIKIDRYPQQCKSSARTPVSGDIRFVRIIGRVLYKGDVKGQWSRTLRLVLNTFSWLLKTTA